jgi:arabinofuranosyltransferase
MLWSKHHRLVACALFAVLLWRTAWVSDDAFITLRTIDNWWHGYGLRWNVGERVQTYTHPLWLLLLTLPVGLSGSGFFATLALSLLVSSATVWLVARESRWPWTVLALLSLSPSFVDFCSSGLENPLTHLLLAALAACLLRPLPPRPRFLAVALIAGFAAVNRLDTSLLYLPALIAAWPRAEPRSALRLLATGAAPLILWESFSLVYYGFLLPNTAYAKTSWAHLPLRFQLGLGLDYLYESARADPVAVGLLALAGFLALRERSRAQLALCAGALLYLAYAVWIGGDFMRGRFVSAPVLACALSLSRSEWLASPVRRLRCVAAALGLSLLGIGPPAATGASFGAGTNIQQLTTPHGVRDERAMFFPHDSLLNAARSNPDRDGHPWSGAGHALRKSGKRAVRIVEAIGHLGYYAGPRFHFVDYWAIADPLLARLPPSWGYSGHYVRGIPIGYLESLRSDSNLIAHQSLARYYAALRTVIRAPLWSAERWREIVRIQRGEYAPLLDDYAYVRGEPVRFELAIRNPGDEPLVGVHLWNEQRTALYALDTHSQAGRSYTLTAVVGQGGLRIEGPVTPVGDARIDRLAERGVFHLSVAFGRKLGDPMTFYQLRYRYRFERGRIALHREPEGWILRDFPGGPIAPERVDGVINARPL